MSKKIPLHTNVGKLSTPTGRLNNRKKNNFPSGHEPHTSSETWHSNRSAHSLRSIKKINSHAEKNVTPSAESINRTTLKEPRQHSPPHCFRTPTELHQRLSHRSPIGNHTRRRSATTLTAERQPHRSPSGNHTHRRAANTLTTERQTHPLPFHRHPPPSGNHTHSRAFRTTYRSLTQQLHLRKTALRAFKTETILYGD